MAEGGLKRGREPRREPGRTVSRGGEARPWWRDAPFLFGLLAGPVTWALLALTGLPVAAGSPPPAAWLVSVLLAPVVEEYLFRGLLQGALLQRPRLARRWFGISGANVLVSIAFAAAHLWSRPSTAAVAVLLPSLALGACRERYGILAPCMVLHAFWNAGFVWLFA